MKRLAAVYGFSMGAMQAYHWAALHPEMVDRAIVICGSACTATHNKVFLSGLLRTLEAAPEHQGNGRFSSEPKLALKAFAHIYAGWGLSQDFYRADLHRKALGAPDLDTFLRTDWVERFSLRRAANLYAQALAWFHGDISDNALYQVTSRAPFKPSAPRCSFFRRDRSLLPRRRQRGRVEASRQGRAQVIPSIWGHRAGNPSTNAEDVAFLRAAVRAWLEG